MNSKNFKFFLILFVAQIHYLNALPSWLQIFSFYTAFNYLKHNFGWIDKTTLEACKQNLKQQLKNDISSVEVGLNGRIISVFNAQKEDVANINQHIEQIDQQRSDHNKAILSTITGLHANIESIKSNQQGLLERFKKAKKESESAAQGLRGIMDFLKEDKEKMKEQGRVFEQFIKQFHVEVDDLKNQASTLDTNFQARTQALNALQVKINTLEEQQKAGQTILKQELEKADARNKEAKQLEASITYCLAMLTALNQKFQSNESNNNAQPMIPKQFKLSKHRNNNPGLQQLCIKS